MKKIIMLITMVMMLAFSAVCSAADGKTLQAEEAAANKFFNAKNYAAAATVMTEDMKKNFDEKAFENFQKFKAEIGKQELKNLRVVEFYDDVHVLTYQVKYEKSPVNQFRFIFQADKPLLVTFGMAAPAPEKEQTNAEK